jgi:hypothetical protein
MTRRGRSRHRHLERCDRCIFLPGDARRRRLSQAQLSNLGARHPSERISRRDVSDHADAQRRVDPCQSGPTDFRRSDHRTKKRLCRTQKRRSYPQRRIRARAASAVIGDHLERSRSRRDRRLGAAKRKIKYVLSNQMRFEKFSCFPSITYQIRKALTLCLVLV